jgi:hypothetical protein
MEMENVEALLSSNLYSDSMDQIQTIDERILKSGEKLPPSITIENGKHFDGDYVIKYNTGSDGKYPSWNEIGALVTLMIRNDKNNPKYPRCLYGGFGEKFLQICTRDDRIFTWQELQSRILSILKGENGF